MQSLYFSNSWSIAGSVLKRKMSTKVEQASRVEHGIQTTIIATSSTSSTSSPRLSMFTAKSGFVIPKNKLSGSLVPIFQGGKKLGSSDAESAESTKQVQRKTKWGPDLTEDASVRKGRALAYQTRVDQITKQLKSGILEAGDDQDSPLASQCAGHKSSDHQISSEESKLLELERREIIGEILKLNPSYKAPANYKPLLKEAKVPIPIKEYPGHNFIGLIFGPVSDTQKRLEKETGAKIRVYGTKADSKKEGEITPADGNEAHSGYEELYVLVSADSYEKVDAAVSLIELLVTPVSVNTVAVSTTSVVVSGDNANGISPNQGTSAPYTFSPVLVNPGVPQPFTGSGQAPPLCQFQPYPIQWFPVGSPSGFINPPFPNYSTAISNPVQVSSSSSNPSNMPSLFGPRPVLSAGFSSVPQNPSLASSGPQPILQVLQHPHTLQAPPLGYAGPPRNPSLPPWQSTPAQPNFSAPPPFTTNSPTPTGPTQNVRPLVSPVPRSVPPFTFPDRPLTSTRWSQAPAGTPASMGPSHMPQMVQPMVCPQGPLPVGSQPFAVSGGPPSNTAPGNMVPFRPSVSHSPSIAPMLPVGPRSVVPNLTPNPVLGSTQIPSPVTPRSIPPPPPQSGIATPVSGSAPSFTPIKPPSITALKPQQPSSNNFTFQPHRAQTPPSQVIPRAGSQPLPQIMPHQNLTVPPPQSPSFRPGMTNPAPPSVMQGFTRALVNNHTSQPRAQLSMPAPPRHPAFPGPGPGPVAPSPPVPQMGPRHFSPAPQGVNPISPFPPRPGNSVQLQQNYPAMGIQFQNHLAPKNQQFSGNVPFPSCRPASSPSEAQQIYDPFSPTSVSVTPQLGGNPPNTRKQESDPEYDDLMATVGVK